MNIVFLLGAGASANAGMPSTDTITRWVLSGEDIARQTDGVYAISPPNRSYDIDANDVRRFIDYLRVIVQRYYAERRSEPDNYEALSFLATQIHDVVSGNFDNPGIQPLVESVREIPELRQIIEKLGVGGLAREGRFYIQDVAWSLLNREPSDLNYLRFFRQVYDDSGVSKIDVFSLNHDRVIEQFCQQFRIPLNDGFGKPVNNVRYWNPSLLANRAKKLRLLKLHGSVDWFKYRRSTRKADEIGIPLGHYQDSRDRKGKRQEPRDWRPIMLVGTFNKLYFYTSGIFSDLHCHFHYSLRKSQHLVVAGYGFGDKGINTKLVEWLFSNPNKRMLVVHKEPDELRLRARGAISDNWELWKRMGRLLELRKWAEEIDGWEEIKSQFSSHARNRIVSPGTAG